jgi:regulator of sirC expression with transglutaminase-like and TPR domain
MILADKRDYTGAAENLRGYLKFAPQAQDADTVRQQLSELDKLTGGAARVTEQKTEP